MGPPLLKGAVTTFNTTAKNESPQPRFLYPSITIVLSSRIEVSVLTKGGRRSQIQTTSHTSLLLNRFEVSVLTKGGGKRAHTPLLGIPIKLIRGVGAHKGGEAIPNPDNFPDTTPIEQIRVGKAGFEVWVLTPPPTLHPPPIGKAGFEVWVLTKGGLVCISNMQTGTFVL